MVICWLIFPLEIDIDEYLANWLLKLSGELTWMQLVLLAMVGRKTEFTLPDIDISDRGPDCTQWGCTSS